MAENLFSAVVKNMGSYAHTRFGLIQSMDENREKVKRELEAIKRVLWNAEEGQFTDAWLAALKKAAYDAEDILDEFKYEDIRCEVKIRDAMMKKVLDFFTPHNPFLFCLIMSKKLKDILDRIEGLAAEHKMLSFTSNTQSHAQERPSTSQAQDRQTHSYVDKEVVIGREEDQKEIVDLLLDQRGNKRVSVFAIVGMGGLGKTTLAQLIYGDERVKNHFQKFIWVCVSEDFDVAKLVKSILDSATGKEENLSNMDLLQRRLREELSGKRYLLVMDDVWDDISAKWDALKTLLVTGGEGSAVLVTTRSHQVSQIMGAQTSHNLPYLSEYDSWTLFSEKRAFAPGTEENPELIKIGKEIVKKCGGLPLAVNVLGSLMGTKKEVKEWLAVLRSEIWDIKFAEQRIFAVLKLSYNQLPAHSKQCFAMCSIFPKDYEMEKDMLIQLWMANGFIPSEGRKELEVRGEEIFDELFWRSFFQDLGQRRRYYGPSKLEYSIATCKMHDLMHDLAQSIMGSECAQLLKSGSVEGLPDNIRHLLISGPCQLDIGQILNKFPTIFTLLLKKTYLDIRTADFSKASSLKALSLESTNSIDQLPIAMRYLKHLRYLDLSNAGIAELPEAICDLFNLQTLKLEYCFKLRKLPEAMRNMRSLRHLYIYNCPSLEYMPAGMGQLRALKRLTKYIVGDDADERGIRELKDLNLGGHLELYGLEKVKGTEDAKEANLGSKHNLQLLALCWGVSPWGHSFVTESEGHSFDEEVEDDSFDEDQAENAEKVLAALEPHGDLKMLVVWRYAGLHFPVWMMDRLGPVLLNLVQIHLGYCRRCEHLPPLWQLPGLEVLSLTEMDSIKHLQSSGSEDTVQPFPSLKRLLLYRMRSLESWRGEEGGDQAPPCFPLLVNLEIFDCPNLTSMPVLPSIRDLRVSGKNKIPLEYVLSLTALSFLHIETFSANTSGETRSPSFPQASISSSLKHMNYLEKLRIRGGEALRPLLEREDETRGLGSTLKYLSLINCNWLFSKQPSSSPLKIWTNLTSLTWLTIETCDLKFWPEQELPGLISLETLFVSDCQNLTGTSPSPESASSTSVERGLPPHLKTLYIINCKNLMELPKLPASLEELNIHSCPNMNALTDHQLGQLTTLQYLTLKKCTSLTSLPEGKQGFTALRNLVIEDCPELTTLPGALQQRIPSLSRLVIKGCPDLERRCKRGGEYWDLVSRLPAPEIGEQRREQPPSFCRSSCLDCFSPA